MCTHSMCPAPATLAHLPAPARQCRAEVNNQQPEPGSAEYFDFSDASYHGSHTAGIVGAQGNNGRGVAGMNWQVSLYICKASADL